MSYRGTVNAGDRRTSIANEKIEFLDPIAPIKDDRYPNNGTGKKIQIDNTATKPTDTTKLYLDTSVYPNNLYTYDTTLSQWVNVQKNNRSVKSITLESFNSAYHVAFKNEIYSHQIDASNVIEFKFSDDVVSYIQIIEPNVEFRITGQV